MKNSNYEKQISELILETICKFDERDSKERNFGTDVNIHHSEIHMIKFIKENTDLHISAIARKLGITRGAVSQTIKRLQSKGLITKEVDEGNNSKIVVRLTGKGQTAYINHENYHKQYEIRIKNILENMGAGSEKVVYDFLLEFYRKI
ncbi:DNA-binding MarR family transcriptional regulator [Clostridium acetobutylicum]|uniref:Transcriptional regulator, MarR/EmrR family n=1 Tax=Clostridium acetobutylicum (strain ATCC 824 / DSM 792 / JCM 1419 / IAM 19013 / LMG 5710 / NBRC 13948 / NRRL B-527 / VKM B-1787 / 2291 / W) TaxID=272562 RepID=Q97LK1_CLOAB|nr:MULTISPECIES: MarR family winged helix-turn-helix transcriptional regulator [Clostridium]AAK78538.1 Transcriptional regulator, MarR/EmrR family [Clostridium acetobutylicum ATCC 824]ADZ19612.1 Transcriptional regulator, MarR/EmrR family [Clostridium acetobutylicum EA 2018]AEI31310.1 MarR family transcriptional regulator [Clostridium acetobutylicum DSM 1731]AWV80261.1 MarR family transcriptional regulator [Clostridium acetobutylicum]KHD37671.1 MarR family transcriptional regulator [Clostridiu